MRISCYSTSCSRAPAHPSLERDQPDRPDDRGHHGNGERQRRISGRSPRKALRPRCYASRSISVIWLVLSMKSSDSDREPTSPHADEGNRRAMPLTINTGTVAAKAPRRAARNSRRKPPPVLARHSEIDDDSIERVRPRRRPGSRDGQVEGRQGPSRSNAPTSRA